MKLSDFLEGVGRPVAYYPSMARMLGDLKEAIFVCQMAYWKGKEQDPEGWIYKSAEEIEAEMGLTYREQTGVRDGLKAKRLLEERYARTEHRLYFRIDWDTVNAMWDEHMTKEHMTNCKMPPKHMTKGQMASDKKTDGSLQNRVSLNSIPETTPETTKELKDSIWESILSSLFLTVPRNTYTFLQAAQPVSFEGDVLTLKAIDELTCDWLRGNAKTAIEKAFPGVIQRAAKVEFITEAA